MDNRRRKRGYGAGKRKRYRLRFPSLHASAIGLPLQRLAAITLGEADQGLGYASAERDDLEQFAHFRR